MYFFIYTEPWIPNILDEKCRVSKYPPHILHLHVKINANFLQAKWRKDWSAPAQKATWSYQIFWTITQLFYSTVSTRIKRQNLQHFRLRWTWANGRARIVAYFPIDPVDDHWRDPAEASRRRRRDRGFQFCAWSWRQRSFMLGKSEMG